MAFPVYRTYGATGSLEGPDQVLFENVLADAAWKAEEPEAVWVIGRAILDPDDNANALELRRRLQQLSGPVMAKAMEDTLFYRYNRLLGLNEVGGTRPRSAVSRTIFTGRCANVRYCSKGCRQPRHMTPSVAKMRARASMP